MKKIISLIAFAAIVLASNCWAMDSSLQSKKSNTLEEGYTLINQHCLNCHDSIADPEKSGMTRDRWLVIIKLMHNFGLELSDEDQGKIIDYLYTIRPGIENQPG